MQENLLHLKLVIQTHGVRELCNRIKLKTVLYKDADDKTTLNSP